MLSGLLLFFGILSFGLGIYLILAEARFHHEYRRRLTQRFRYEPTVAVIAPIKSPEPQLMDHIKRFLAQDYPNKKVKYIFIVDSRADPAYPQLKALHHRNVEVSISKPFPGCSGKIAALLAGIQKARAEVLVFADTDGAPHRDWLGALVSRLASADVSSGFRFYLPNSTALSYVQCAWNNIGSSQIFSHRIFAWGGACAIRRKDFLDAGIPAAWKHALSDDLVFSNRMHVLKKTIVYEPRAIVFSPSAQSVRQFFEFSNRQMIILRTHVPRLHAMALMGIGAVCFLTLIGIVAILVQEWVAAALLLSIVAFYIIREGFRFNFYTNSQRIKGSTLRYAFLGYVAAWVFTYNTIQALFRNTIEWRGRRYHIKSPHEIGAQKIVP